MQFVYHNAKVYTGEEQLQQAFLVEDGRFVAVGSDEQILSLAADGAYYTDLDGRFVCPGFNDSHIHLLSLGDAVNTVQLAGHSQSLSALLSSLRAGMRQHELRRGRWLLGRGWNEERFYDIDRMPTRDDLDSVSNKIPIMITRACGRICVVNTRVLRFCGIDEKTRAPVGGAIGRDKKGRLDGRLYGSAMDLVLPFISKPTQEQLFAMIRKACRTLNSLGFTSVQTDDYALFPQLSVEEINAAYRELEAHGLLRLRVRQQASFGSMEELRAYVEAGNADDHSGTMYKLGPLKLPGDGTLLTHTAHLSRPYADRPDTCGLTQLRPKLFSDMVSYAHAHGMQVAIQATGDACIDLALDALERALKEQPREDHRHGIIHCQITRPEQLERIRELKLHVYAQTIFMDYDNHIVADRVGPELAASSYSWKTLLDGGVSVSNGTACPVELPDVMRGIECAVTRCSMDATGPYRPEEALSLREALDSFTIRGAEASFEEQLKGRIAPGFLADFVVLSRNPFATAPQRLHRITVDSCYLGGSRVYP